MIDTKEISDFLNGNHFGIVRDVKYCRTLNATDEFSLSFCKKNLGKEVKGAVLVSRYDDAFDDMSQIVVPNPRLAYAKAVKEFFCVNDSVEIHETAMISPSASIGLRVSIGPYCHIGDEVRIGDDCKLNTNVVIFNNVTIGDSCYIKSGTVVGEDGFGFDFEEDGTPFRLPHIGSVRIGNNVEIGSNCTIARGTIEDTIVHDHVKMDDQVHIGHNCRIGSRTIITAQAEFSGGVTVEEDCWIAPNCSIIQKITIGKKSLVGIGAVVTSNVEPNSKVMGFEAQILSKIQEAKKRLGFWSVPKR